MARFQFTIPEGKNLKFTKASVEILGIKKENNISNSDKSSTFQLNLKAGVANLKASFYNRKGEKNVAYYVYIMKTD